MTTVIILFGTESGNAEMAATDIAEALGEAHDVTVVDLADHESPLEAGGLSLIVCSTHGDGELPGGAQPYFDVLESTSPDLSGAVYAMFGLGDSSYDTYSQGSELLDAKLRELGAVRVGVYGRHDADAGGLASDAAVEWALTTVATFDAGGLVAAPAAVGQ